MAFPIAGALSAGANIAGNAINAISAGIQNKKERNWNEKMYQQQKNDSLSFWHMQNEYNSPLEQMKRLQNAGLNPNLVYDNGATHTASSIPTPSPQSYTPKSIKMEGNAMADYFNTQQQVVQTDLLRQQIEVSKQDNLLKALQGANIAQQTETGKFDLGMKRELASTSLETAKENLRKLSTDVNVTLNRDSREEKKLNQDLKESVSRIASNKANTSLTHSRITNQDIQNTILKIEEALAQKGIFRTDPLYLRTASTLADGLSSGSTSTSSIIAKFKNILKNLRK